MKRSYGFLFTALLLACTDIAPTQPIIETSTSTTPQFYFESEADSLDWHDEATFTATGLNNGNILGDGRTYSGNALTGVTDGTLARVEAVLTYTGGTTSGTLNFAAEDMQEGRGERFAPVSPSYTAGRNCGFSFIQTAQHKGQRIKSWNFITGQSENRVTINREWASTPVQKELPPCPSTPPPDEGCSEVNTLGDGISFYCPDEVMECEVAEYGLFIRIGGVWYLLDSWWEWSCEDGTGGIFHNGATGAVGNGASGNNNNSAERAGNRNSLRVKVVLVPDAAFNGGGARSMLLRQGTGSGGQGIILIRESQATAQEITNAYAGLQAWVKKEADHETAAARGPVQVSLRTNRDLYPWANDLLASLRLAPTKDVPGIGRFKTVDIE